MKAIEWLATAAGAMALAVVAVNAVGARHWDRRTRGLIDRLDAGRLSSRAARYDEAELEGLPPVVQRYLRAVLVPGQPIMVAADLRHRGEFNLGQTTDRWKPFTSEQHVVVRRPGFVWNGCIQATIGVPVRVHDAYIAGEGLLRPAVFGLVTLVDMRGSGELARGELMRYLAETPWYPTALLPSQGVHWQAVDEHSARVSLQDGEIGADLLFRFGADGLVESVYATQRGRTVGKIIVPTPWEGRWSNYQLRGGMKVPMDGEVAWLTEAGRKSYWRGTLTFLQHEPSAA